MRAISRASREKSSGILLWGLGADKPLAAVRDALWWRGHTVLFLDQAAILRTEVELCIGATVEGKVCIGDQTIDLSTVSAVYLRPYDFRELPCIARAGQDSAAWRHAQQVEEALMSWIELTPALVVNRPSAMATNSSKPYQAALISSHGFDIPRTLITTDPQAALAFWQRHETIIYKSVSGIRSVVSRLTAGHRERLDNITNCPTQFQQYIPGIDYRVHVIGQEIFACKIASSADDYRYASQQGASAAIQPCDLPEEIATRCRTLAAALDMHVVGIDLRCTPEGKWYCFEVNPSPGYTFFQDSTRQPISDAIAHLLLSGKTVSICTSSKA